MSTEVVVLEPREVVITNEDTDLIKKTICAGATEPEMKLFFYDCRRRGVHPLDKLIHFTKRSGKYTPITSIDFMRQRAQASGAYAGEDEPVYTTVESGDVDTCKYTVYRFVQGQRCQWTATARWNEYYPGDQLGFMWKKMPYVMLTKCAEALALRKAFPAELQGLYVKEEMEQANGDKPSRKPSDILKASEQGTVLEPGVQDYEQDLARAGASPAPLAGLVSQLPAPVAEQAAGAADDPAEPFRRRIRQASTEKEAREAYETTPITLAQDVYTVYLDTLKALGKKKK